MKNIYVCEQSEGMRAGVQSYFKEDSRLEVRVFSDAAGYVEAAGEKRPDAVMIDLEFDGLKEVYGTFGEDRPKVVLTSRRMREEIETALGQYAHDAVVYKPYSLNDVRNELGNLLWEEREKVKLNGNKNLDERLSNIFIRAGIPPHIKGYQYLRSAVKLAIAEPEIVNSITKRLYPTVAEYYRTTPSKVERAIRHAIEVAWTRGKIENINAIFGIKIYGKGDKPTNGELIALVADKMVIELMPD